MKNLNLNCPINNTGYGIASINILKELNKNYNISYFPIGGIKVDTREDHELLLKLINNSYSPDPTAPALKIWHQFDLFQRPGKGKYYAMPFFELDTFNKMEIAHLSVPDCIFAPSSWAKEVIENNVKTNVEVVPLGVDQSIFNADKIFQTRQDNKYVFLNIGKWEVRKGHDILLELFESAFPDEKDVELWILASETTNSYSNQQELDTWKKMYSSSRIKIFSGVNYHHEIAYLIAESDCGIYPSRAEGWNLELLECMSMGKPVICTNYSAHKEFCTKNNSFLVDIDGLEPAYDGKAFKRQGNWAKIDSNQKDQFIEYMRYCYKNRIKNNEYGIKTANDFSWKNSAKKIMGYIS